MRFDCRYWTRCSLRAGGLWLAAAAIAACHSKPEFQAHLPRSLALEGLQANQRQLLRATLEVEGVLVESDLLISSDQRTVSGFFPIDDSGSNGKRQVTLRLYGRYVEDAAEVILAEQSEALSIDPSGENEIALSTPWHMGSKDEPRFDRNRNGVVNLEDLRANVDPSPPGPLVRAGPSLVKLVSGASGDRNVISIGNISGETLTVTLHVLDAPGAYLSEFSLASAVPTRALSLGTLQPFAHKLVALSFLPPNSYVQSGAVLVAAVERRSGVRFATTVELVGNSNEAARLQPVPQGWQAPTLPGRATLGYEGQLVAYPVDDLFSGQVFSTAEDGAALKDTLFAVGDLQADLIYHVGVPAGFDFFARLWGLSVDIDLTVVPLDAQQKPLLDAALTSASPGTSAEGLEIGRQDEIREYLLVLSVNEPTLRRKRPEALHNLPFLFSAHAVTGPRFASDEPITPKIGGTAGGEDVKLSGFGFSAGAQVFFNGIAATGEVVNAAGTQIDIKSPASVFGSHLANVQVVNPSFSGESPRSITLPNAFQYVPPAPAIDTVLPATVVSAGGTPVTLRGRNLEGDFGAPLVLFGETPAASVVVVDKNTILVISPPLVTGTQDLTVRVFYQNDRQQESTLAAAVNATEANGPPPTITAVSPLLIAAVGGTEVTLTGTGFATGATLLIGDSAVAAEAITDISPTSLTFLSPVCLPGRHSLRLVGPTGQTAVAADSLNCEGDVPQETLNDPIILNIYKIDGDLVHGNTFALILEGLNLNPGQLQQVDALASDGNAYSFITEFAAESLVRIRMSGAGLPAGQYRIFLTYNDGATFIPFEAVPRINIANDCGNGVVDGTETCEADTPPAACSTLGYQTGQLSCGSNCTWEVSQCRNCGNGKREGAEQCDGTDLGGNACDDIGYLRGSLSCLADCSWDTSLCIKCGNGVAEEGEECDTDDLPTCESLGFIGGTPSCSEQCKTITSDCHRCGDNTCASDENNSTCAVDCSIGTCGNSICEPPETCTTCPADCSCAAPFAFSVVSGDMQTGYRGAPLGQVMTVRATDLDAQPLGNLRVEISRPEGAYTDSTTMRTDALGYASTGAVLNLMVGSQDFVFRAFDPDDAELPGSPLTFTHTATEPPDGLVVPIVSHVGNTPSPSDGAASQTRLFEVQGLTVGPDGDIFVSDTLRHRVLKITPSGASSVFAGGNGAGFSGDFGPANAAKLNKPAGLFADDNGSLYIADLNNDRVRRVDADGDITTVAGGGPIGQPADGDGGLPSSAYVDAPQDVAFDAEGRLLIVQGSSFRIRQVAANGLSISTIIDNNPAFGCKGVLAPFLARDTGGRVHFGQNCNGPSAEIYRIEANNDMSFIGPDGSQKCGGPLLTNVVNDGYVRTFANIAFTPGNSVWLTELGGSCDGYRVMRGNPDYSLDVLAWSLSSTPAKDWVDSLDSGFARVKRIAFHPTLGVLVAHSVGGSEYAIRNIAGTATEPTTVLAFEVLNGSDSQAAPINGRPASPLAVRVVDGSGAPLSNVAVSFAAPTADVYIDTRNTSTINGLASSLVHAGLQPDVSYVVTATASLWRGGGSISQDFTLSTNPLLVGQAYAVVSFAPSFGPIPPPDKDLWHASESNIGRPAGLAHRANGDMIVSSTFGCRVWEISAAGAARRFAGTQAVCTASGNGGAARNTTLRAPGAVAVAPMSGEVAFVEFSNPSRVRVVLANGTISTMAGGFSIGCGGNDDLAVNASFMTPRELDFDDDDNLYVVDIGCNNIRRADGSSLIMSTQMAPGCDEDFDVGAFTGGVAVDRAANQLYFTARDDITCSSSTAAPGSQTVHRIDLGEPTTAPVIAGGGSSDPDGAMARSASFSNLVSLAVANNTLYISDSGSNRIFKLDLSGTSDGLIHRVVGTGTAGKFSHPEPALSSPVDDPRALSVGPDGNLYFADRENGSIRMVVELGGLTTEARPF